MKSQVSLALAAVLICGLACAQVPASKAPPASMGSPPPAAPPGPGYPWDFAPLIAQLDTNKDGKISLAEWKASGICESIFTMLHGSKEGDMTVTELIARSPQAEADTDHTRQLTVKKMIWVCNAGPAGAPPPGAAPPGGAGKPAAAAPPTAPKKE